MGRNKTNLSRDFFTYNEVEQRSYCNKCCASIKGDHAANLERHLKRHHVNEFEYVQQKKKSMKEEPTPNTSRFENPSQGTLQLFPGPQFFKQENESVKDDESDRDNEVDALSVEVEEFNCLNTIKRRISTPEPTLQIERPVDENASIADALKILRENRDECEIFGQHIACKIRKYNLTTRNTVEYLINNILYEADMGKYDKRPTDQA